MAERRRWVRRNRRKVPLQSGSGANASSTVAATWSSYSEAEQSPHGVGLGYVLAAGDGICCIDLDHCLDGPWLAGWAGEILDRCPPTYVEVSPSGTGLHIFGHGTVGTGRRIRDHRSVEVYDRGRYICVTGRRWRGAPRQLADLTGLLASMH